jgi:hypothetical protein
LNSSQLLAAQQDILDAYLAAHPDSYIANNLHACNTFRCGAAPVCNPCRAASVLVLRAWPVLGNAGSQPCDKL